MEFNDKNNNLTLFFLLVGTIILVLCYKKSDRKNILLETFQQNKLEKINRELEKTKENLEKTKEKIKHLMRAKQKDVIYTNKKSNKNTPIKEADVNISELSDVHNTINEQIRNYDENNFMKDVHNGVIQLKNNYAVSLQKEIDSEKDKIKNIDSLQNTSSLDYHFIKNPYHNVNLQIDNVNDNKNFVIYNNNKCLSYENNTLDEKDCSTSNTQYFKHEDNKVKPFNSNSDQNNCLTHLNNKLTVEPCDDDDDKQWWNKF